MAIQRYTLEEIEAMDREFLTPTIVGGCLRWDPYSISLQAKADPSKLGFPVIRHGTRTLIPKEGFLNFCRAAGIGGARV
ncbi:MAG: hypothetical protein IJU38_04210 [Clostridia bacterium]|nr:hypothetical protein [Clostridia bacterium]